jgi:hypothetical protein
VLLDMYETMCNLLPEVTASLLLIWRLVPEAKL